MNRSIALQLVPNPKAKRVEFRIIVKQRDGWVDQANPQTRIGNPQFDGTVKRGSATCPCCGYTTPVVRMREQLKTRCGGAIDARLLVVITTRPTEQGRFYRLPTSRDLEAIKKATEEHSEQEKSNTSPFSLIPVEELDVRGIRRVQVPNYGMNQFAHLFTSRQALALATLARLVRECASREK